MKAVVSDDPRRVGVEVGSGVDEVQVGEYVVLDNRDDGWTKVVLHPGMAGAGA